MIGPLRDWSRQEYPLMDPIAELIAHSRLCGHAVILDGALATELEARGADLRDELWSARVLIERPELIRAVHADYFRAGADVATTATYQASFAGFARRGIDADGARRLMRRSVELAREARDGFWSDEAARAGRQRPLIAASIGPWGAALADGSEYRGHYPIGDEELRAFHRPRLDALADSGADLFAIETIPSLREARVLAQLVEELAALPAWIAFSCRDDRSTCEGQDVGECAAALEPFGRIVAVGLNCTPPRHAVALLRRMRAATARPLLAYPNSGEDYDAVAKRWVGCADSASYAEAARLWQRAGASLIGGCCRTSPADIRAVRAALA